jgi:hypothetical protein
LVERIHQDGKVAEKALDLPIYACYKDSSYFEKMSKWLCSPTAKRSRQIYHTYSWNYVCHEWKQDAHFQNCS